MSGEALTVEAPVVAAGAVRIGVFRCCRPLQFEAAVRHARRTYPDAEIVAISHTGHQGSLRAAGVDRIIEVPGVRFGLARLAPHLLWRLRRLHFDHVIVPTMGSAGVGHRNVCWLAIALARQSVTILDPGGDACERSRPALSRWLVWASLRGIVERVDVPMLLALLVAARFVPRRTARPGQGRRRVLHIIPSLGIGGAQRQLAAVVDHAPPGDDLEVLVFGSDTDDFARPWLRRTDVPVTSVREWPRFSFTALEIAALCRKKQYDVVHAWLSMANAVGVAGARLAGVPRVVASERNLSLWKRTWYREWWYRPVDALTARAADVVTVNAAALATDHGAWTWTNPRAMVVVHNGLDPRPLQVDAEQARAALLAELGCDADARVVGTVGRLAPEKDHATFLRVVRALHDSDPRVRGVVIGDGQLRDALAQEARSIGLDGVVTFLGARRDVARLVAALDVFVMTSVIEGFPNALLEAVMLGVPACATRVGGCPDVLDDEAVLFDVGDTQGCVRLVRALLRDRAAARRRAGRARQRALSLFNVARTADAWQRVYRTNASEGERHEA